MPPCRSSNVCPLPISRAALGRRSPVERRVELSRMARPSSVAHFPARLTVCSALKCFRAPVRHCSMHTTIGLRSVVPRGTHRTVNVRSSSQVGLGAAMPILNMRPVGDGGPPIDRRRRDLSRTGMSVVEVGPADGFRTTTIALAVNRWPSDWPCDRREPDRTASSALQAAMTFAPAGVAAPSRSLARSEATHISNLETLHKLLVEQRDPHLECTAACASLIDVHRRFLSQLQCSPTLTTPLFNLAMQMRLVVDFTVQAWIDGAHRRSPALAALVRVPRDRLRVYLARLRDEVRSDLVQEAIGIIEEFQHEIDRAAHDFTMGGAGRRLAGRREFDGQKVIRFGRLTKFCRKGPGLYWFILSGNTLAYTKLSRLGLACGRLRQLAIDVRTRHVCGTLPGHNDAARSRSTRSRSRTSKGTDITACRSCRRRSRSRYETRSTLPSPVRLTRVPDRVVHRPSAPDVAGVAAATDQQCSCPRGSSGAAADHESVRVGNTLWRMLDAFQAAYLPAGAPTLATTPALRPVWDPRLPRVRSTPGLHDLLPHVPVRERHSRVDGANVSSADRHQRTWIAAPGPIGDERRPGCGPA